MSFESKNPFTGYTQVVTGSRFIGRTNEIMRMTEMVITPDEDEPICNLAVIGMHGIGKSSLVKHTLLANEVELFFKRRLPIWINMKDHKTPLAFFQYLAEITFHEISQGNQYLDQTSLERLAKYKPERTNFDFYFPDNIRRFFAEVKRAGLCLIFVLEEFDHARILFARDHQGFENLRQLAQDGSINYITLCRRTIKNIELQTMAGSTLDSIFKPLYVTSFEKKDLCDYFSILATSGVAITPVMEKQILAFCGGHPYLLAMFGWELFTIAHQSEHVEIEQIFDQIQTPRNHYFENVIKRLQDDHNIETLLHIIFGPKLDITQKDISELCSYGLIQENTHQKHLPGTRIAPAYVCFAESFQTYISDQGREEGLYSFVGKTELALRDLITLELQKTYGRTWLDELKGRFPREFQEYENTQTRDKRQNRVGVSDNLIDYTYIGFLCKIVFEKYWSTFARFFQKDPRKNQQYWKKCAELISEVRNPVMHLRLKHITTDEHLLCKQYCQEILTIIEEYRTVQDG